MSYPVDISNFLDQRKVSSLQVKVAILCGLTIALDSFDPVRYPALDREVVRYDSRARA